MKDLIVVMIIFLTVYNSCSTLDNEPESESYFPLKTCNAWYYNRLNYNHNPYLKLEIESKIESDEYTYCIVKNILLYSEPSSFFTFDTLRIDSQGRV